MSDLTPAPSAPAPLASEQVRSIRQMIAAVDDQRAAMYEAGDIEGLANGAADLDIIAAEFSMVKRTAQGDIARLLAARGERSIEVEGLGVVEVKGGSDRRKWESRKLLRQIILDTVADAETGEVWTSNPIEIAENIEKAISACIGMTGSTSWKVGEWDATEKDWRGGIRSLGYNPEDWCEETPKPNLASIPKRKAQI